MPTKNPRVHVTLTPEHYEVAKRLAAASGQSMSQVIAEVWEVAAPVLARVAHLLEEAQAVQASVKDGIRDAAEGAIVELEPIADRALLTFDLFEEATRLALQDARRCDDGVVGDARSAADAAPSQPPSSNTGVRYQKTRGATK